MSLSILDILLLFGVGSIAGFVNVLAGGGSALTLPALIFLGLDSALANGTNRLALISQNLAAVSSFKKNKLHDFPTSLRMALYTLPGAVLGAMAAVHVSDALFQRILGLIMIGIGVTLFISPAGRSQASPEQRPSLWLYPLLFAIGFYGGFIQAGVGFLFIAVLFHLGRMNLVRVNMHKVFIILLNTVPAFLVFVLNGKVLWVHGFVLAAGNSFGAWWGAHAAVRGGDKVIRVALSFAILIMAAKLFGIL
ncbi:TSUP family transporter [candidate division KSB1 bacterium]|nr:TSUP family transporter [candidate division KSB1 bacterium]